ncbi:tyrosine-type recombinase/integrase [Terriglobus sp.]|uniref:tyrosine-type recombinase/integrase n=1 Tax=Terriglobus sp. TaxID=1889013 RepID=UPI003B009914
MANRSAARAKGVWEKEPGSGVWWIRYRVNGRLKRERVGRKKDAISLYAIRKSDLIRGAKMPANLRGRGLKFEVIGREAIEWYIEHGRKDVRSFRIRMNIILKDFGGRIADEIKPSEIDAWLKAHEWAPATKNRYKNVFGKTFKIALSDGKVSGNPARLVEQRPEKNARLRFLSHDEEAVLRRVILKRCAHHIEEFDIALHTGMRKGEQYSVEWPEVFFKRNRIQLEETKNGSSREIPLNRTSRAAYEALYARRPEVNDEDGKAVGRHAGRVHLTKWGANLNDSRTWWELAVEEAAREMLGLQGFTWHCLRHTFISRLVMAGVDLRTAQELAGHKTISMTVRYAHLAPEHNQAAIDRLDPGMKAS